QRFPALLDHTVAGSLCSRAEEFALEALGGVIDRVRCRLLHQSSRCFCVMRRGDDDLVQGVHSSREELDHRVLPLSPLVRRLLPVLSTLPIRRLVLTFLLQTREGVAIRPLAHVPQGERLLARFEFVNRRSRERRPGVFGPARVRHPASHFCLRVYHQVIVVPVIRKRDGRVADLLPLQLDGISLFAPDDVDPETVARGDGHELSVPTVDALLAHLCCVVVDARDRLARAAVQKQRALLDCILEVRPQVALHLLDSLGPTIVGERQTERLVNRARVAAVGLNARGRRPEQAVSVAQDFDDVFPFFQHRFDALQLLFKLVDMLPRSCMLARRRTSGRVLGRRALHVLSRGIGLDVDSRALLGSGLGLDFRGRGVRDLVCPAQLLLARHCICVRSEESADGLGLDVDLRALVDRGRGLDSRGQRVVSYAVLLALGRRALGVFRLRVWRLLLLRDRVQRRCPTHAQPGEDHGDSFA
ncbi:hypothetical protein T484DRAFT_2215914, partial [Baffinella frigidus]